MSISTLVFALAWIGAYKLGSFNERHPGKAWTSCREAAIWIWSSINK